MSKLYIKRLENSRPPKVEISKPPLTIQNSKDLISKKNGQKIRKLRKSNILTLLVQKEKYQKITCQMRTVI
jgi:hypothetical protein